ncbi:RpL24 [Bugula neritina]|uniref:RpL24 n=1 Tax=Bugula neritina TaxID=10212 RepID=A0A7J7JEP7_BUGNE|nr:RpL24 [Bugula neritina]
MFLNKKSKRLHLTKRNPPKDIMDCALQKKAVAGATINEIMAKRNQKPEVRKAQREQAIRAYKEKQKAKVAAKKPAAAPAKTKAKGAKLPKAAASGARLQAEWVARDSLSWTRTLITVNILSVRMDQVPLIMYTDSLRVTELDSEEDLCISVFLSE